jgi:hypothetical protein
MAAAIRRPRHEIQQLLFFQWVSLIPGIGGRAERANLLRSLPQSSASAKTKLATRTPQR